MKAPVRLVVLLTAFYTPPLVYSQPAGGVTITPQPLARDVMYRVLFREIAAYRNAADQLAAQSKPDAFIRNYHEKVLELSAAQATQLIQIAMPCVQRIQAIDSQASAIIQAVKTQHKNAPRNSPNAVVPPPPQELAALEAQRATVILAAADSIAAAFGPAQFAYFENLVRRYVGSSFKASPPAAKTP